MKVNPYESPKEAGGGPPTPDPDAEYRPAQFAIWAVALGILGLVALQLFLRWNGFRW